jgi:formate hydrogenlyase subunit 4
VVVVAVKLLVGVLVIALFENSMARLRFVERRASPGPVWFCIFSVRLLAGGVIKESIYV